MSDKSLNSKKECPTCEGKGKVIARPPNPGGYGRKVYEEVTCPDCNGTGKVSVEESESRKS